MVLTKAPPWLDNLRSDPRYDDSVRRVNSQHDLRQAGSKPAATVAIWEWKLLNLPPVNRNTLIWRHLENQNDP